MKAIKSFEACFDQMPQTDQIATFNPYALTYFWDNIKCKYHAESYFSDNNNSNLYNNNFISNLLLLFVIRYSDVEDAWILDIRNQTKYKAEPNQIKSLTKLDCELSYLLLIYGVSQGFINHWMEVAKVKVNSLLYYSSMGSHRALITMK